MRSQEKEKKKQQHNREIFETYTREYDGYSENLERKEDHNITKRK